MSIILETDFFLNRVQEWMPLLLLFIVSLLALYFVTKRRVLNLPPGPIGLPFIGYYPFVDQSLPHKQFQLLAKKYGDVFSLNMGGTLMVVCNSWEAVKDAYGKTATANRPPELFRALRYGLGFGTSNGPVWTHQRRFTVRVAKDLGLGTSKWENFLQEEVKETVERLKKSCGQPEDISPFLSETFTNNILTLLFGYRLPSGHKTTAFISYCLDEIMHEFATIRLANFLPKFCETLGKLGLYGSALRMKVFNDFSDFTKKWVKQRLLDHKHDGTDSFIQKYSEEIEYHKSKETSVLFTKQSLYTNSQVLLLGGSETSRTTLIWLLIAMAENPDYQHQVQEELDAAMNKDGVVSWSDRAKFPLTYACIMEGMRHYVTVPMNTLRITSEDIQISGYDVPKGSYITSNIWAIHHDTRYWEEPEKFNPQRFLSENGTKVNLKPESFMPFSYGKRSCPGEQIASMEILCYFSSLLRNFSILPAESNSNKVKHGTVLGLTCQATDVKLRFLPR